MVYFSDAKVSTTLADTEKSLPKDEVVKMLMYLTSSKLDMMFVVCACAKFQVTPNVSHLTAVKRIFRYLKGQPKLGLWYPRESPLDLVSYSDIDYLGASMDRKSTTGGCQCNKQTIVAISTIEV